MKAKAVIGSGSSWRTREAPSPSRGGRGIFGCFARAIVCSRLSAMDLTGLLEPVLAFFSEGVGKAIFDALTFVYKLLYPANAEAAKPVVIPK